MSQHYFAVTLPGLEEFTRRELAGLGIKSRLPAARDEGGEAREESGGVEFHGGLSNLYKANLYLRTASRVLLRLGEFRATAFAELRAKAALLEWETYLLPGQAVTVRATCHKSRLYHSDGVAERVAAAIGDRLGAPVPPTEPPAQLVVVRILHDRVTISLDTSGELLHRRGYRLESAKAPLRETLAAGLLLASGWDAQSPLLDPFCGSGTIAIEAALLARHVAPGKNRRFAFMDWPGFNPGVWKALLAEAVGRELPGCDPIQASDRDAGAVRGAQANAERAGVAADIEFACQAFSAIQPPRGPGWVVTNPPYGVRVSEGQDLRNLYSRLGDVLRALCPGWQVGLLTSSDFLAGHTRLHFEGNLALHNGGLAVRLYTGRVEGGSA